MKILITGSNGLLGQKLIDSLMSSSHEWLATSSGQNRHPNAGHFNFTALDITKPEEINAVFNQFKPQVVIHTAAMTHVDQCELSKEICTLLNITATEYLIHACNTQGCHLVHLSTDFIFDGSSGPYIETDIPNPISYYGHTKWEAEKLIEQNCKSYAIARTVLVFGKVAAMSRTNIVLWVIDSLRNGKTIQVVDDQWRTPTDAQDLAVGCILLAEKKAIGIYHVSGEEMMTPYQMAMRIADYYNLDKSLIQRADSTTFSQPAKRPPKTGFIISKMKTLGYYPRSFETSLAELNLQI